MSCPSIQIKIARDKGLSVKVSKPLSLVSWCLSSQGNCPGWRVWHKPLWALSVSALRGQTTLNLMILSLGFTKSRGAPRALITMVLTPSLAKMDRIRIWIMRLGYDLQGLPMILLFTIKVTWFINWSLRLLMNEYINLLFFSTSHSDSWTQIWTETRTWMETLYASPSNHSVYLAGWADSQPHWYRWTALHPSLKAFGGRTVAVGNPVGSVVHG